MDETETETSIFVGLDQPIQPTVAAQKLIRQMRVGNELFIGYLDYPTALDAGLLKGLPKPIVHGTKSAVCRLNHTNICERSGEAWGNGIVLQSTFWKVNRRVFHGEVPPSLKGPFAYSRCPNDFRLKYERAPSDAILPKNFIQP